MKHPGLMCLLSIGVLLGLTHGQEGSLAHQPEDAAHREELRRLQQENPQRYQLMLEQDRLEGVVQRAMDELEVLGPTDARDERAEQLRDELLPVLEQWFGVRQSIRESELEELAEELEQESRRLQAAIDHPSELAEEWRDRVLEGGPEAMEARIHDLRRPDPLRVLAPHLLGEVAEQDPALAHEMERLASRSEERFLGALELFVHEQPEFLERAMDAGREEFELHDALREAVLAAHELARPGVEQGRPIAELDEALGQVVQCDIAIARQQLDKVRVDLERRRQLYAMREAQRELIIRVQWSRILGHPELYEW